MAKTKSPATRILLALLLVGAGLAMRPEMAAAQGAPMNFRLAQIEGVRVLNLNDLANAVKPIVGAGESIAITIVKEGKEPHQGVGYFEDGTMVVVENGRSHVDETVTVTVTTVLQTTAGRMIFATLADDDSCKPRVLRPVRAKVAQR